MRSYSSRGNSARNWYSTSEMGIISRFRPMTEKNLQDRRQEFVEEHTPFEDWREFIEARRQYQEEDEPEAG